jgi:hypothetical protein
LVTLVWLHIATLLYHWCQFPPRTAGHYWSEVPGALARNWWALTNAQAYLVLVCALLVARHRLAVLAGLVVAGSVAWIIPIGGAHHLTPVQWTWMVLACYLPMSATAIGLVVVRMCGWRLQLAGTPSGIQENLQFSLRGMLLATTAVASLLALSTSPMVWVQPNSGGAGTRPGGDARYIDLASVQICIDPTPWLIPGLAVNASLALLTPVTCLTALGLILGPLPFRAFLTAIVIQPAIILAMYLAAWRQFGEHGWESFVDATVLSAFSGWGGDVWAALLLAGSLLIVRLAGYRLVRRERVAEGAAV